MRLCLGHPKVYFGRKVPGRGGGGARWVLRALSLKLLLAVRHQGPAFIFKDDYGRLPRFRIVPDHTLKGYFQSLPRPATSVDLSEVEHFFIHPQQMFAGTSRPSSDSSAAARRSSDAVSETSPRTSSEGVFAASSVAVFVWCEGWARTFERLLNDV